MCSAARASFRESLLVAVLAAVLWCSQLSLSWSGMLERGAFIDDAFFYSRIATSVADRGAFEFFPGMPTNGFQPLWMWCVAGFSCVFQQADSLVVLWCLQAFFAVLGAWLWFRLIYATFGRSLAWAFILLTACSPAFFKLAFVGLETGLLWALLPIWLNVVSNMTITSSLVRSVVAGVFAGLIFLARTDCAAYVVGATIVMAVRDRRKNAIAMAAVSMAIVSPYLINNLVNYGGLMPLSGRAKQFYLASTYPDIGSYINSQEWMGFSAAISNGVVGIRPRSPAIVLAVGLAAILISLIAFRHRTLLLKNPQSTKPRNTLACSKLLFETLTFGSLLHLLLMYGYHRELRIYTSYYFVPELIYFVLVIILTGRFLFTRFNLVGHRLLSPLLRLKYPPAVGLLLFLWMVQGVLFVRGKPNETWETRMTMAAQIRSKVPDHATIGAYWPGAFSYGSGRDILPLDGIIASRSYQDNVMMPGNELEYLCALPEPYLVIRLPKQADFLTKGMAPGTKLNWSQLGLRRLTELGMSKIETLKVSGKWALLKLHCANWKRPPAAI